MKHMKKVFALMLAVIMTLAMSVTAFAADNAHTITIKNTDEQAKHTYEAYQVFDGDLNADESQLSNIKWGSGVNGAGIINDLITANSDDDSPLKGKFDGITSTSKPEDVAKKVSALTAAADIEAFAAIVGDNLTATVAGTSSQTATDYTISVAKDGYYFIKDQDASVTADGEHYTKYILNVVKDTTINAKDTHTNSDKVIVENNTDVRNNDKAIGDTITYKSTLDKVPDPARYNRYHLEMNDTMEPGLTFTGITSISLNDHPLTFGTDYYYYVGTTKYDTTQYVAPTDPIDAGAPSAATEIRIVFKDAKKLITDNNAAGKKLIVNYTAVLNKNAEIAPASNDNTSNFEYSNNPNYNYEGDEITSSEPSGETPDRTVETYTTTLELLKTDATTGNPLAGATFEIEGTAFNTTLVTATEFVPIESGETGTHWKLKDGSYTTTDPATVTNTTQYEATGAAGYKKITYTKTVKEPVSAKYTLVSDDNGKIYLEGVKEGTYTIKETVAPNGYNKLDDTTTIIIKWDSLHDVANFTSPTDTEKQDANGGFSLGDGTTTGVQMTDHGAKFTVTIENKGGTTLPSTGGIGTTMFYAVGAILVIGAGIVLVTRRRMSAN